MDAIDAARRHDRLSRTRERAATSVEFLGLGAAAAVLAVALVAGLTGQAPGITTQLMRVMRAAVDGEPRHVRTTRVVRTSTGEDPPSITARRLAARIRGADGGRTFDRRWRAQSNDEHTAASAHVRACALCDSVGESHDWSVAGGRDAPGVSFTELIEARMALVSIDADAVATWRAAGLEAQIRAAAGADVGARASAQLDAELSARSQRIRLGGDAFAGAEAHGSVEGKLAVPLIGVAVTQSARGDAWAGAGAKGRFRFEHHGGHVEWHVAAAAAAGVGGGGEWSGSIDVDPSRLRRSLTRMSQPFIDFSTAPFGTTQQEHP